MATGFSTGWALGVDIPVRSERYKATVAKRKKILEAAKQWNPLPALGVPPEEVAEPFTVMLWGITTDKVKGWLKGADAESDADLSEITGFASSAGVVEGKARVLKLLKEIVDIEPGEILVCASTNPSWAPIFTRISAAVTDIGGLTSHAAIVCREYGIPSVTGTGIATTAIKTGDVLKVDGDIWDPLHAFLHSLSLAASCVRSYRNCRTTHRYPDCFSSYLVQYFKHQTLHKI